MRSRMASPDKTVSHKLVAKRKTRFTGKKRGNFMNDDTRKDLDSLPLAMAYVPMQQWRKLYSPEEALRRGTMFEELDLPFLGEEGVSRGK